MDKGAVHCDLLNQLLTMESCALFTLASTSVLKLWRNGIPAEPGRCCSPTASVPFHIVCHVGEDPGNCFDAAPICERLPLHALSIDDNTQASSKGIGIAS